VRHRGKVPNLTRLKDRAVKPSTFNREGDGYEGLGVRKQRKADPATARGIALNSKRTEGRLRARANAGGKKGGPRIKAEEGGGKQLFTRGVSVRRQIRSGEQLR